MEKHPLYLDYNEWRLTIPCLIDIWNSLIAKIDIPTAWMD